MASVRLTDRLVSAASAAPGERLELYDKQVSGLVLRVTDQGRKTWVVRYRTDDGRQPRFTLGTYPAISLADARTAALDAVGASRKGSDPSGEKRRTKAEAKAQPIKTMDDLGRVYFSACETGEWKPRKKKKRASTLAEERRNWDYQVKPALGDLRIEDVTPAAIKKLLRGLVAKGHGVTANRVRSLIRQAFNFALAEGRVAANPISAVAAIGEEKARDRVLTDDELRAIWRSLLDTSDLKNEAGERVYISRAVGIALQLATLTLQRRGEVAQIRRVDIDLDHGLWTIPAAVTKNGRQHVVPLSGRAIELVREAIRLADEGRERPSPCLFPSPRDRANPITPAALSHAMGSLRGVLKIDNVKPHDLRRTGASLMASERLGVTPFVIGRVLNHVSELGGAASVTLKHYAVHDFASEKRSALVAWENLLLEIVGERVRPSNVVSFEGAA